MSLNSSEIKELFLLNNSDHVITADQERTTVARRMVSFFTHSTEHISELLVNKFYTVGNLTMCHFYKDIVVFANNSLS